MLILENISYTDTPRINHVFITTIRSSHTIFQLKQEPRNQSVTLVANASQTLVWRLTPSGKVMLSNSTLKQLNYIGISCLFTLLPNYEISLLIDDKNSMQILVHDHIDINQKKKRIKRKQFWRSFSPRCLGPRLEVSVWLAPWVPRPAPSGWMAPWAPNTGSII